MSAFEPRPVDTASGVPRCWTGCPQYTTGDSCQSACKGTGRAVAPDRICEPGVEVMAAKLRRLRANAETALGIMDTRRRELLHG